MNEPVNLEDLGVPELKRAVVNNPRNAELRYLLGAEMAQQKDYDGAVMEMSAALALNPLLHTARLQLGLLHLTMARPDHTIAVLEPLENLDDSSPLKHFKKGLEALIRDDFANCTASLQRGIELNRDNEPLNRDMGMLLSKVKEVIDKNNSPPPSIEPSKRAEQTVRTDFSLYDRTKN